MPEALTLDGVYAGYGDTVVLENIRLTLSEGETLAIIGRNGVGKSTLLATVLSHTTLHGGRVLLHGKDISRLPTYTRVAQGLGYVPQEREIFPSLSLRENLDVAARPAPGQSRRYLSLSRDLPSGRATGVTNYRAVSSRCWRSGGRWSAIRASS